MVTSVTWEFSANIHSPGGFPKNQPHKILAKPDPEPQLTGDFVPSHIWYHLTSTLNPLFPFPFFFFFFPSTPAGVDNCSLRESFQILECKVIPELRIPRLLTKTRGNHFCGELPRLTCYVCMTCSVNPSFFRPTRIIPSDNNKFISSFWPSSMGISRQ